MCPRSIPSSGITVADGSFAQARPRWNPLARQFRYNQWAPLPSRLGQTRVRDKDGATLNATARPPGLEFSTTHLTWNESQGCGELEYYGPDGNKIAGNTPQERRQNALAANAPWRTGMHSAPGASMELPASAPGEEYPTYEVKLTTKPSATVKVNVYDPNDLIWWGNNTHRTLNRVFVGRDRRASNGRGGAGKPTLTFTPSNWDQWQTVKAKVACTDHFPDAVPLKHVIQGEQGDFDGAKRRVNYGEVDQSWTVWVRVNEAAPPVEIEIEAESKASGLPPAGQTITLAEGATRDFRSGLAKGYCPTEAAAVSASISLPSRSAMCSGRRDGTGNLSLTASSWTP